MRATYRGIGYRKWIVQRDSEIHLELTCSAGQARWTRWTASIWLCKTELAAYSNVSRDTARRLLASAEAPPC